MEDFAAYVREHPGCTTDEMYRNLARGADWFTWTSHVYRAARSQGIGQLLDGRWFHSDANPEIRAAVALARPTPGYDMWWAYVRTPLSEMTPELRSWGPKIATT